MPTDNKAVFYGRENDDNETLTPRFMGALLNPPDGFGLYGADASDALGISAVATELDMYVAKMNYWQGIHNMFCSPFPWWCTSSAEKTADGYRKGVNWFSTLNPAWKEIIGASQVQLIPTGNCKCTIFPPNGWPYSVIYPGQIAAFMRAYVSQSMNSKFLNMNRTALSLPNLL